MMKKHLVTCLTAAVILGMGGSVFAAEPTLAEQEAELAALKDRLAVIEMQISAQQEKQKKTDAKLRKKAESDIKVYGDARIRSISQNGGDYSFEQRVRINLEKKINRDTTFRLRNILMNENEMGTSGESAYGDRPILANGSPSAWTTMKSNGGNDVYNKIDNAYMEFNNISGDKNSSLKIGRFGHDFGKTGYWSSDGSLGMYDGLEFTTGNKLKVSVGFGDWGGATSPQEDQFKISGGQKADVVLGSDSQGTTGNKLEKNVFIKLNYKPSKATSLQVWHIRETNADSSPLDYEVTGVGFKSKLGKDLSLAYDYSKNVAIEGSPVGQFATLAYGDANYNRPQSYEARLYYANVDKGNVPSPFVKSINIPCNDNRGIGMSLHYVMTKNVMAEFLTEFDMKKKSTGADVDNYYRFQISSNF